MTMLTMSGREKVAAVLRNARRPLSPDEVSDLAGMPLQTTKSRLADLVGRKEAGNTGGKYEPRYVWLDQAVRTRKLPVLVTTRNWRESTYTGEPPLPLRPGALDFLECPHLINGQRVERRRPALVSMREA